VIKITFGASEAGSEYSENFRVGDMRREPKKMKITSPI